jgi:eukaryotic-like serine/threonine-protein kinase
MTIPEIDNGQGIKYSNFVFFKKGGMGEIYKGSQINTDKEVILKLIVIENTEDESLLNTEIEVSSQLLHTNIVKTLGTGKINIEGNNYLFIIQEYYSKGNLRSMIKDNIPLENCCSMMLDILYGMNEIHKTIVHRDLKPENILVDTDNHLLITDFGLAKYIDEKTRSRSFKGFGTIPYMAPECWTGDNNTISMDIYSLGIIFFEIITGNLPSNAKNDTEWREFHLFTSFPNISNYRSGITIKFNQIIQKMTNKRINERYKTVNEIITAINEAIKINTSDMNEAERLAQLGNFALQKKKSEELKMMQEIEKKSEWIMFINYQINELFNNVIEKVNAINERLEEGKILVNEQSYTKNNTSRKLTISFGNKNVFFQFSDSELVNSYEDQMQKRSIEFQRRQYGMVMQSPGNSFLKTNKIIVIGLAETGFKIGNIEYGFNLLLKQIDNSNYGEWYIMQFSRNITPPETSFGLDLSIFFDKYEEFKSSMFHTMKFQKIQESDIIGLIERLLIL